MQNELGKTLLIVNPVAKKGAGQAAGVRAAENLEKAGVSVTCVATSSPAQGAELAASAAQDGYQSVIALGGDGIIHEIANGLMKIEQEKRPALGIIPVGSGNDYARTLGMSEDVGTACAQLLSAQAKKVDVGICNCQYFVETLSFGIDAAIALDTVQRRLKTNKTGGALYFEAGINQLVFHRNMHAYRASFDKGDVEQGKSLTFAVQIGCTYGGGFRICPEAVPDDGLFDICIAHPPIGLVSAIAIFSRARNGKHVDSPKIQLRRASSLSIQFEHIVPAQMDGEDCSASSFEVRLLPKELSVYFGKAL